MSLQNEQSWCIYLNRMTSSWCILMNFPSMRGLLLTKDGRNKGIKGFISKTDQNLTFSVAVWFSKKMIYRVMATWKTFNSQAIKYFYHGWMEARQKLELDQQDRAILVGDNSKIHKSKEIREYLLKSKMRLMMITPYSPWLNPWEQLIGAAKSKLRRELLKGR